MVKRPGRPRVSGIGRKDPQHKRHCVSNKDKVAVLAYADEHTVIDTVSHFFPHINPKAAETMRKSVYKWRAKRSELERRCSKSTKSANSKYDRDVGVSTVLRNETELVQWINVLRQDGAPVSAKMLQLQAIEVAAEQGIKCFKASWHWRAGFMRRHRLSLRMRTRQGQVTPDDAIQAAIQFGIDVQQKMLSLGVSKVYNADQTGMLRF